MLLPDVSEDSAVSFRVEPTVELTLIIISLDKSQAEHTVAYLSYSPNALY